MVEYSDPPLDRVFQALADPTRRALLTRLRRGSATVSELAQPFPTSLAAVSKHLQVLERAGLLTRQIEGREHHCALDPAPLKSAAEWLDFYRRYWEDRLAALDAFLTRSDPDTPGLRRTHARTRRRPR
jgi:DNA-binding transcriptional ArsR family regulator